VNKVALNLSIDHKVAYPFPVAFYHNYEVKFNFSKMKRVLILALMIGFFACEPRQGNNVSELPPANDKMHEIVVQEVLQANSYTYIKATENDQEIWMAILKNDIDVGKKYYYDQAMEMKNFASKDLDRTFESIYFLEGLYENPTDFTKSGVQAPNDAMHGSKSTSEKQDISIQKEEGVKSINYLYDNKEDLNSQKVIVKGVVTKYNPNIMNKNWVHIQDGTGDENSFDLTITTKDEVKVGAIVKFEGTVVINQDFGHGYEYDLLLQDAVQLDKPEEIKIN
jgi:hypothetical protein